MVTHVHLMFASVMTGILAEQITLNVLVRKVRGFA